jgi:hypothetical protein
MKKFCLFSALVFGATAILIIVAFWPSSLVATAAADTQPVHSEKFAMLAAPPWGCDIMYTYSPCTAAYDLQTWQQPGDDTIYYIVWNVPSGNCNTHSAIDMGTIIWYGTSGCWFSSITGGWGGIVAGGQCGGQGYIWQGDVAPSTPCTGGSPLVHF